MTTAAEARTTLAVLRRMFAIAEEIAADPTSENHMVQVEEFAALAYQIGLDVSPPDHAVQRALKARGLLARPFRDDTGCETDDDEPHSEDGE